MANKCPICETELKKEPTPTGNANVGPEYECSCCGKFMMTSDAKHMLPYLFTPEKGKDEQEKRAILSHGIKKMQRPDKLIILNDKSIKAILSNPLPSLNEQADNLIRWFAENVSPGVKVNVEPLTHQSIIGAKSPEGFSFVLRYLMDRGLLVGVPFESTDEPMSASATLSFEGWQYYDQLKRGSIGSHKAFMAMEYGDPQLDKIVENYFIKAVACTGFELIRLDKKPKAGLIDDRLRVEIQTSRFLISDLTHENSGAYWEAGYAEGLGKPVIYTCEKQKFEENKTHFDTNHHLTIVWESTNPQEAAELLKATIRATLPDEAKMND